MKRILYIFIILTFCPLSYIKAEEIVQKEIYYEGKVIEVIEEKEIEIDDNKQLYQELKIRITNGDIKDKEVFIENGNFPVAKVIEYNKGDNVLLSYTKDIDGNDMFFVTDHIRTNSLLFLFMIFIILSVVIGTKKGLLSLISMSITFIIIFSFVLPYTEKGYDPIMIAIISSIIIIPITFYLSHGFEKKTTVAVISTFISLVLTGILSVIAVNFTYLTGMASEESIFLQSMGNGIDYNLKGLLLAGIIIGTLGVLDDITISQTAVVYQLKEVKEDITLNELFRRSLKVGRDHIASMINTLILVYTGASLPLLILFLNSTLPFNYLLNSELLSTEVVRTLVGSIGLILAVPITTYIASYYAIKKH